MPVACHPPAEAERLGSVPRVGHGRSSTDGDSYEISRASPGEDLDQANAPLHSLPWQAAVPPATITASSTSGSPAGSPTGTSSAASTRPRRGWSSSCKGSAWRGPACWRSAGGGGGGRWGGCGGGGGARRGAGGAAVGEIGGGVGEIEIELLQAGAARAQNLELSPAYEQQARTLAAKGGVTGGLARAPHHTSHANRGVGAAG